MTEERGRASYETKAGQWYRWQYTARDFVSAANYLLDWYVPVLTSDDPMRDLTWQQTSNLPIMVLYATAVENLLKAIRIAQGEPATKGGVLNRYLQRHDMLQYAKDAGLRPSLEEAELLKKLRHLIEAGKYPVATAPGGSPGAWTFEYPSDVERVWNMLERLEEALRSTGKPTLPAVDLRRLGRG